MITLSETFDMVHGATAFYRTLLQAAAGPGREVPAPGQENFWMAAAATLLDGEVRFYWDGDAELEESIRFLTGARCAPPEEADFLLIPDGRRLEALLPVAKTGTFEDPHLSATLLMAAEGERRACRLSGPGIRPGAQHCLPADILAAMELRDAQGHEYPCGVDLFFYTGQGVVAIPRLTRKEGA